MSAPRNQLLNDWDLSSCIPRMDTPMTMPRVPSTTMVVGVSPRIRMAKKVPQIGAAEDMGTERLSPIRETPTR